MVSPCACTLTAYVGIGSNMGDPELNVREAVSLLKQLDGPRVEGVSPIYFTEPQGVKDQPWYANAVAKLLCPPEISPRTLLHELLRIESELGRDRGPDVQRFGPRVIDLDLLLFGDSIMDIPELTLPHPRMRERAFVLIPLQYLAPDLCFPDGESLADAIAKIPFRVHNRRIEQS